MDNLEEIDTFLEKINLPILNEEEIEKFNRPITSTEIETTINNYMPIKWTTWKKWTNPLKSTTFQT